MDKNKYMLPTGTTLNSGRYEIIEQLSSGGFGNTYKVKEVFNNKVFAMKEFFIRGINERKPGSNTVLVSNDENIDTFKRQMAKFKIEAERLRDLANEHIVKVHDFFPDNDTYYYVMDFIDGVSLDERKRPLPENEVWGILDQVLDALDAIHRVKTIEDGKERLWVHLDIKPANLMIDKNGKVTLIDFGASKQLSAETNSSISLSQMTFTRGYAPLEQTSQRVEWIGPWTDFYALGATLFALQTNASTQIPEYSDLLDKVTKGEDSAKAFLFPKNMSERMRKLIARMMHPIKDNRPQSVKDIKQDINAQEPQGGEATQFSYTLKVNVDPVGNGTVEIKPKKDFYEDEMVSCIAVPQKGCQFQGWYDSEDCLKTTDAYYHFEINQDINLKAKFTQRRKQLFNSILWAVFVGIILISVLIWSLIYIANSLSQKNIGEKSNEIIEMVNNIEKILPANTWNGQFLKKIEYNKIENAIELTYTLPMEKPEFINNLGQFDITEQAMDFIYQFKKGYVYLTEGKGGEGDPELYKEIFPMLKAIVRNEMDIIINFIYLGEEKYAVRIKPQYTEEAILRPVESIEASEEMPEELIDNIKAADDELLGNTINGHEYVDLGLPSGIKWATCNVGASSPSDYGDYFAWGETTTKSEYTYENSKSWGNSIDISGNAQYDAARANWGGSWRLPTKAEYEELNKCIASWTTQGGHKGYKVTGLNGKSIFFPSAGCRNESSLDFAGQNCYYWSSTPYSHDGVSYVFYGDNYVSTGLRNIGCPIRPVSD